MLLGDIYIKNESIILQDVDSSEVALTITDALDLAMWIVGHLDELEPLVQAEQAEVRETQQVIREHKQLFRNVIQDVQGGINHVTF